MTEHQASHKFINRALFQNKVHVHALTAWLAQLAERQTAEGEWVEGSSPRPDHHFMGHRALANEDTLLPTQMFPRLPARATFVVDTFCVRDTKNVSDFVQKHFVSATNVSQFARARKRHEQQYFRNNASSFASTYILNKIKIFPRRSADTRVKNETTENKESIT